MLALKGRQDKYRLLLPDELIPVEIKEKYTKVLRRKKSFIYSPIDLLNESIQKIQILGFTDGTIIQQQGRHGLPLIDKSRKDENWLQHTEADFPYRSPVGPMSVIDKTLNVTFRHELGFLNYFMLFESFFYQHSRDQKYDKLPDKFAIEIFNELGEIYARILLYNPLIDSMDMLDLDFSQPVASSQTFTVVFKYSDMDLEFIEEDAVSEEETYAFPTKEDVSRFDIENLQRELKNKDKVYIQVGTTNPGFKARGINDTSKNSAAQTDPTTNPDPASKFKGGIYVPNGQGGEEKAGGFTKQ